MMSTLLGNCTRRTRRITVDGSSLLFTYTRPTADTFAAGHIRAMTDGLALFAERYLLPAMQGHDAPYMIVTCGERPLGEWVEIVFGYTYGAGDLPPVSRTCKTRWSGDGNLQLRSVSPMLYLFGKFVERKSKKTRKYS